MKRDPDDHVSMRLQAQIDDMRRFNKPPWHVYVAFALACATAAFCFGLMFAWVYSTYYE